MGVCGFNLFSSGLQRPTTMWNPVQPATTFVRSETRTPGQEPHSLCCGLSWQWTPLPPTENISHVRLMSAFPPLLIFSVWDVLDKFQDMIHHDCLLIAAEPQPSSCHLWEGSPGNSRLWHTKLPVLARAPHDGCTQLAGAWAVAAGG